MRNDIKIVTKIGDELVSHFTLREFETTDGFVMIDGRMPLQLELSRRDINAVSQYGEIAIRLTCCVRTTKENNALGYRLGFTDEGGAVSRTSKHLPQFGGIAVDCVPYYVQSGRRVSKKISGPIFRKYFTYVKDDYADGHSHCDLR